MLDELFAEIGARGWRLNALGQSPKGLWMCQLETKDHYPITVGHKATANGALAEALAKIDEAERYNWLPPTPDEMAIRAILAHRLKPKQTFARRA